MLGVVCLSALVKHRGALIRRILENQGAFEEFHRSQMSNNNASRQESVLEWLGAGRPSGCPAFPFMSSVRAVALALCENLGIAGEIPLSF